MKVIWKLMLVATCWAGCDSAANSVNRSSTLYNLKKQGAEGHAIAFDSRARGTYIVPAQLTRRDGKTVVNSVLRFCAEPPPDTSANLKADLVTKVGVDASVAYQAISAALKTNTENTQSASSTVADVVQRTELTLVLRDSLYRLCELNLNGVMSDEEALKAYTRVMDVVSRLAQRDNVGKLIALLGNDKAKFTGPETKELLALIHSLTVVDQVCEGEECKKTLQPAAVFSLIGGSVDSLKSLNLLSDELRKTREQRDREQQDKKEQDRKQKERQSTSP